MVYAIVYAYGRDVANRGNRADQVHQFKSQAERVIFLDGCELDGIEADTIRQAHPKVRKALRHAAQGYDWPQLV